MDVEKPLKYVDFFTEKDARKSKVLRKRKRVGNRRPIGEKIAKSSAAHRTPKYRPQRVPEPESDAEESANGMELNLSCFRG